jgi:hypothetical protein
VREREAEKHLSDAMLEALISLGIETSSGAAPSSSIPWNRSFALDSCDP